MITQAIITYDDGSEATFTGSPLDLTQIPVLSSAEKAAGEVVTSPVVTDQAQDPLPSGDPIPGVPDETTPTETTPAS